MFSRPAGISALVIASMIGLGATAFVATGTLNLTGGVTSVTAGAPTEEASSPAQTERPDAAAPSSAPPPSPPTAVPSVVASAPSPTAQLDAPPPDQTVVGQSSSPSESSGRPPASAQRLDLNTADLQALRKLPQLTRTRARAIIKGRPYGSVADLADRKVISKKAFAAIKDFVEVR